MRRLPRTVWAAVNLLDFSAFDARYANDAAGASALDPRRLTAVWIVALLRGVNSSVQLAQACSRDVELRWLLGGGQVHKSTLSEFRKAHLHELLGLCTQTLSALAMETMPVMPAAWMEWTMGRTLAAKR
mgnify:CR=1 FL=1